MSVSATVVVPPPVEPTITLSGLTMAQAELMMAALRSFHTAGLLSATKDAQAVEDALQSAGVCRKGRLPKPGRKEGDYRRYYVADKSEHSVIIRAVTDPAASDEDEEG